MQHTQWIWNRQAPSTNCYVDFITDIELDIPPDNVALAIAADTEYAVWINNTFVNCGQYHSFPQRRIYDLLPVTEFLCPGKNRISITVYYQGELSYQYAKGNAGLWFVLTAGETLLAKSDALVYSAPCVSYHPGAHRVTPQYGFGFVYNANQEDDWRIPSTPIPDRFSPCICYEGATPSPRPIEKCVIHPLHKATLLTQGIVHRLYENPDPAIAMHQDFLSFRHTWELFGNVQTLTPCQNDPFYIIVDLGREMAGYVSFSITAKTKTVIDIAWGEHLLNGGVSARIGNRSFASRYIAKPGKQSFTHYFKRIAGRYLQLHIHGEIESIESIGLYESVYPVQSLPTPQTGDFLMDKIMTISRNTLLLCMHEHYEDCPWREQGMYASDSRDQILCGYYAFGETKFVKACLDLMGQSMDKNGFLAICAPTDEHLLIPSFTFIWILSMAEYIQYTGDLSLSRQYFPAIFVLLRRCTKELPEGIAIHPFGKGIWNFYEWAPGCDGGNIFDPEPHLNYEAGHKDGLYQMFLYMALKSAVQIAEALQEMDAAKELKERMIILKQGIHSAFWNDSKQRFASFVDNGEQNHYCQLMQAMAVYNDIADSHTSVLCKALMQDQTMIKISLFYTIYVYDALLNQGETYKSFVWNDMVAKWGHMLYEGSTSFWETEIGAADFGGAGSLCHGFAATPLYIYRRYYEGISPDKLKAMIIQS